jgi:hypothetical protein
MLQSTRPPVGGPGFGVFGNINGPENTEIVSNGQAAPARPRRSKAERLKFEEALEAAVEARWPRIVGDAHRAAVDRCILAGTVPVSDRRYLRRLARRLAKRRAAAKIPLSPQRALRLLAWGIPVFANS